MRKPGFAVVQCSWCKADHWHVVRNILTSKVMKVCASYTDKADADADAEQRNAAKRAREAVNA